MYSVGQRVARIDRGQILTYGPTTDPQQFANQPIMGTILSVDPQKKTVRLILDADNPEHGGIYSKYAAKGDLYHFEEIQPI